ncbi:MAG: PAS domain S-box protein [Desulfobacteraceae bacterium]|nr:PAS domain S-box protein [Desulfobacteraceae bacterium]
MDNKPSNENSHNINLQLEKQIDILKYAEKINYTLFDISNAVNSTHNLEELYQSIYDSLNKLMPLPNFFIAIYDNKNKTINFEFFVDEYDDDFSIIENLEAPNCLTGEVILAKRPLFLKENMLCERAEKNRIIGTIPKVWLGVPLIIQEKVIGIISVQSYTDPDYFSHKHLEILISVSDQIAIAIERKQILDALEKKEKTLSLITGSTSSIVIIVDSQGAYEFVNPAHKRLGYEYNDLKNISFFDLIHSQDIEKLMLFLEKGMAGSAFHISLVFRIKDKAGIFHRLDGTFDLIRNDDGFMEKIVFIGEDISDKKKAQKALHESEERFSLIFDTSPDSIIITNLELGTVFAANKAFIELSGMKKNDIIGRSAIDIGIWKNNEQRVDFISNLKEKGFYDNLEANLFLNNKKISTLVSSRLLELEGSSHIISIIRDISDRKELEEQLLQRQKMDSIATLSGGIAHDFNNLLSGIMGYLELLSFHQKNLSDNQKDNIANALISSKRAAKLIRQLQTLTNSNTSDPESVDVNRVASDVFNILEQTTNPQIEKKNELVENQFFIDGYEDELHQAFMNLGMNAIQSIETKEDLSNDSIRIYVPQDTCDDSQTTSISNSEYLHLCFQDTGCGMAREVKKKAFDPMFSTKKTGGRKGQGLGLALVYYIVTKKHGGSIDIETKEGEGTTFHIYLPIAKKAAKIPQKDNTIKAESKTILVIEDEDMVRDMAVKALKSFGYNSLEATDGKMGIGIYKKNHHSIDAVLLDIIMPKMSGTEAFKQMLEINPHVKVIIASGHITNQDQKKMFAKASAYLDKPYQIMELKQVLHAILE